MLFSGSEQDFRAIVGVERARVLLLALERADDRARQINATVGFLEERTEPTLAFDIARSELIGVFDALPGVREETSNGQHLWIVEDRYAIRIKRFDSGYQTANHPSVQQSLISGQQRLPGFEPLIFVSAGARCSKRTGLTLDYIVVKHYPSSSSYQRPEWIVDLRDLAQGDLQPVSPMFPFEPAESPKQPAIRPRLRLVPPALSGSNDGSTTN